MTREEKFNKYSELRDLVLDNDDIAALSIERNETLDKLLHNQKSSYSEPIPNLTPKDDLNLPKEKQLSDDFKKSQKENIEQTQQDYDEQIYNSAKEHFEKEGYNDLDDLKDVGGLDKTELGILLEENGVDKLIEYQKEQELEKPQKEQTKNDLPTQMDDKKSELIYGGNEIKQDKSDKQVDLEKVQSHEKDFKQNNQDIDQGLSEKQIQFDENKQSTLDKIRLDEQEMDAIMDDQSMDYVLEETEKTKEKDTSKDTIEPSSPADNYE